MSFFLIDRWIDFAEISIILLSIVSVPFGEVQAFTIGKCAGRFFRPPDVGGAGLLYAVHFVGLLRVFGVDCLYIDFCGPALALLVPLDQGTAF